MWPDRVSNPGPLIYESGALPTALRDPAMCNAFIQQMYVTSRETSNSYTMICPSVRGDNPRALASGLSPVQADKPCCSYFIPLYTQYRPCSV